MSSNHSMIVLSGQWINKEMAFRIDTCSGGSKLGFGKFISVVVRECDLSGMAYLRLTSLFYGLVYDHFVNVPFMLEKNAYCLLGVYLDIFTNF